VIDLASASEESALVGAAVEEFMGAERHPAGDRLFVPDWERSEWMRLFSRAEPLKLEPGEVLIQQSEEDSGLFFVVSGKLQVAATSLTSGSVTTLGEIVPGSVVGELAFFDHGPRSAKAWAVVPTTLLKLTLSDYMAYSRDHPAEAAQFLFAMNGLLSLRLRATTARL